MALVHGDRLIGYFSTLQATALPLHCPLPCMLLRLLLCIAVCQTRELSVLRVWRKAMRRPSRREAPTIPGAASIENQVAQCVDKTRQRLPRPADRAPMSSKAGVSAGCTGQVHVA